ncbi:hypothetical protein HPB52_005051 [Rhipicephalus sanguineus]|uniref:Uncharacterized protein n=1 Tax=Rhipicephalus sanguineus TaxID=34632 RepID=A0A9D4QI54_RHISA|nr:hypothetical protein HPB52_005051 [Rhipicephalus sanguineus]
MQLDAVLALNGITAQPMMHAALFQALPVELHHLAAATTSSPQPYDDLCAAVLARYGETYRPLPGTREFRFPLRQRDRYHPARSPPMTATYLPGYVLFQPLVRPPAQRFPRRTTSPTMFQVPTPEVPAPEVPAPDDVPAAIDQSATRCVFLRRPRPTVHQACPAIRPSSLSSPAHDTALTSASRWLPCRTTWS